MSEQMIAAPPASPAVPRRLTLLLVQTGIVLLSLGITVVVSLSVQERQIRASTEERVTAVARSLSTLPAVRTGILSAAPSAELQPVADLVAEASGMDYVVITDAAGIRLTHPDRSLIGEPASTDFRKVLAGETFVGVEVGTLGPSLRAKMPVTEGTGTVIGTASVGILESGIAEDMHAGVAGLIPWALGSLAVGIAAAALVTMLLGRRLDRLAHAARDAALQRRVSAALGEQSHEFTNRLHVLYGLLEDGESAEALDYISTLVPVDAEAAIAAPDSLTSRAAASPVSRAGLRHLIDQQRSRLASVEGVLDTRIDPEAEHGADTEEFAIIANLLGNAVEATPAQGTVFLGLRRDAAGLRITVLDDGAGIAAPERQRIFEQGYSTKALDAHNDDPLPRGYGLALVARILADRGGWITVEAASKAGRGCRIEALVPPLISPGTPRVAVAETA